MPSTLLLTLLHPHSCQWTGQALMCLRAPARTFFPRCPRLPHLLMQSVLSAPSAARLPGATSLKRTISTHSLPPLSLFFLKRRRAPPDQMSPDVSSPQPTYLPVMHLSTCLLSSSCPLPFTHHSKSDPGRGPGRYKRAQQTGGVSTAPLSLHPHHNLTHSEAGRLMVKRAGREPHDIRENPHPSM